MKKWYCPFLDSSAILPSVCPGCVVDIVDVVAFVFDDEVLLEDEVTVGDIVVDLVVDVLVTMVVVSSELGQRRATS